MLKSRDICLLTIVHIVKAMFYPVVMYRYESWTIKKAEHQRNWWFWTVVLEKPFESHLDCKEIKPVSPKGNQLWILIGRTDAEVEAPNLWLPEAKKQLTGKDWYWDRLRARGEGSDRGWDGWMASLTQWIWVWTNSQR